MSIHSTDFQSLFSVHVYTCITSVKADFSPNAHPEPPDFVAREPRPNQFSIFFLTETINPFFCILMVSSQACGNKGHVTVK